MNSGRAMKTAEYLTACIGVMVTCLCLFAVASSVPFKPPFGSWLIDIVGRAILAMAVVVVTLIAWAKARETR
jgi:hypothetical protein